MPEKMTLNRRGFLMGLGGLAAFGAFGQTGAPQCTFGAVTDAQYCDCDPGSVRYYRNSLGKLRDCVAAFNGAPLDFAIQLGDLVDRDLASFDPVLAEFAKLRMPLHHALGNHDFPGAHRNAAAIYAKLGLAPGYYDFTQGAWRFIVLDGNDASFRTCDDDAPEYREAKALYDACKAANRPNAQNWNGGMSEKQLAWMRATLAEVKAGGQRALVFSHYPVWPENEHNLWNDAAVLSILENAGCVAAYINGHNHAGNYAERNGIHYVTLHGVVDTPDTTAYAVVQVYSDRLEIRGEGREESRSLLLKS